MPRQARGRYVEDPKIRSMRVRTWFRAVTLASKLTAAELEEEFSETASGKRNSSRSCIWDKYRRGETVPRSGRRNDGRPNLVERVEKCYPATARWLVSPIWRLADTAPIDMAEIRKVYCGLPPILRALFVMPESQVSGPFWRNALEMRKAARLLFKVVDLHELVAVIAIVKEAEVCQQRKQYLDAIALAKRYFERMEQHPVIGEMLREDLRPYLLQWWQTAEHLRG